MTSEVLSVKDIVNAIKTSLEFEFSHIEVSGEISNLSPSKTGHIYFTLSDADASLSCALFRGDALRNPQVKMMRDGDKVVVSGPINVYSKRGTFQLIAKKITKAGKGDLKQQFEALKQKLLSEGLFEATHKKEIPKFPGRIAVLTAATGAAVHDFVNIIKRRSIWCDVLIIPCLVQGDQAPKSLIKALRWADSQADIDLILLTRGGGSLEDLWAFNDEQLVREIYKTKTPTISAVGHQVDFSLSDFVADLRLETPSAAAEYISEPQTKIKQRMDYAMRNLGQTFRGFKLKVLERIEKVNPSHFVYILEKRLGLQRQRLGRVNLHAMESQLAISDKKLRLEELIDDAVRAMESQQKERQAKLDVFTRALKSLSPHNVLERGYTYLEDENSVITSYKDFVKINPNSKLRINFYDGSAEVKKV